MDDKRPERQPHPPPRAHERPRPRQAPQGHDPVLHGVRPEGHQRAGDREAGASCGGLQRDRHREPGDPRGPRGRHGGRRLLSPHRLAQPRAHRGGHRGGGHRARRPRAGHPVRQGTRGLRPPHREEPGHRPPARLRPRPARRGGAHVPQGGVALRHGASLRPRGQRGQAPRRGGGLPGLRRRAPDLRRLRLRQGVLRGAPVARDPALQDRAHLAADGAQLSQRARVGAAPLVLMALTLNTLDQAFEKPDAATVAKTLAELDGRRNLVATLAHDEATCLQASGSAASGLTLMYQDGSVTHRYRSVDKVPLARATDAFQQYLRGESAWRESFRWEEDEERVEVVKWYESWWAYIAAFLLVIGLFVYWRGWH